jgi:hypothetical protein
MGMKRMRNLVMSLSIGSLCEKKRGFSAAVFTVSLLFGGCGMLPSGLVGPAPDLALFQEGLDSFHGTTSPDAFSRLAAEFPDSPWTSRARAIEKALDRATKERLNHNEFQKKLDECRVANERLTSDVRTLEDYRKKLDECSVERERLSSDLRSMENYTLRLKSLLTEAGIAEPVPSNH